MSVSVKTLASVYQYKENSHYQKIHRYYRYVLRSDIRAAYTIDKPAYLLGAAHFYDTPYSLVTKYELHDSLILNIVLENNHLTITIDLCYWMQSDYKEDEAETELIELKLNNKKESSLHSLYRLLFGMDLLLRD